MVPESVLPVLFKVEYGVHSSGTGNLFFAEDFPV
jgi:hypothetical protein